MSWGTIPICLLRESWVISLISWESIFIEPEVISWNLNKSLEMVDLPAPVGPTIARELPWGMLKSIDFNMFRFLL